MNLSRIFDKTYTAISSKKGMQLTLIIAVTIVSAVSLFGIYNWYRVRMNRHAQQILAQCLEEYQRATQNMQAQLWHDVERACEQGYSQYSSTDLSPFFLALQADALLFQDKATDALVLLNKTVANMSKSSPLYYLYATKLALMIHDYEQNDTQLQQLAQDSYNPYRDMAQYYLGYFAFAAGNTNQAQELWESLRQQQSIWAQRAQSQLQGLGA